MEIAYSVNNVPIRLTYERWYHIIENHDDLASYFHDVLDTMEALMAKDTNNFIGQCVNVASDILRLPAKQVWIDYDEEADVLYMSFRRPQRVTETVELDDDMLLRKDGEQIVGLTILNASMRGRETA